MKKILTIFLVMLTFQVFSQEKNISGTVVDDTGQPLLGVTILIKGVAKGTVTDFDGAYTISAKAGDVLVFSFLGTETKEVTVGSQNTINVTLITSDTTLDEVVVVGYGSVRKSDLTGSVSSIKSEDIENIAAVSFEEALSGRAAGLVITSSSGEPGSPVNMQIRGISSLNDSQPLYIIDGVQMENGLEDGLEESTVDITSESLSPLAMLNQADIESIEILKDASSTAIYGSRGASGVVLITTKKGKEGKGVVQLSVDYGIAEVQRLIDVLDSNQYYIMNNERILNAGNELNAEQNFLYTEALAGQLETNNWQELISRAGTQSTTTLSFSGGTKDIKYSLSGNVRQTDGPVLGSAYDNVSTRARINANVSKKLSIATNISFGRQLVTRVASGSGGAYNRAIRVNPLDGINIDPDDDSTVGIIANPIDDITRQTNSTLQSQFVGNVDLTYNFTDALNFKSSFAFQERNTSQRLYQSVRLVLNGRARTQDTRRSRKTLSNTLNFNKKIGKSSINAVLGQELQETTQEAIRVQATSFPNDLLGVYALDIGTFNDRESLTYSNDVLVSIFGRLNYTLKNKYLFTLTGRYDGASKFAANKKWAFFNAAAFAYKLSEEEFIKNIDAISEMKFRVSYGTSGNQAIGTYQSLDQYEGDITAFNADESTTAIFYQNQLPNADLEWETTSQIDGGLDLGLFKNRFSLTLDYYNKITDNLLFTGQRIGAQSGFTAFTQNNGALDTKGFEVSFDAKIIRSKKFKWNLTANAATGKTVITDLEVDLTESGWNPGFIDGGTQRLIIGEEIGTFYGYKTAGIAQFDDFEAFQGLTNQEQIDLYNSNRSVAHTFVDGYSGGIPFGGQTIPGSQLFEDISGPDGVPDGVIDNEDLQIIGRAQPDVTLGLTNNFSFGNFSLRVFLDSQINKDIYNHANYTLLRFNGTNNSIADAFNRWTPENPSNVYPRVDASNGNRPFHDRYIEDGSFIRLQNVTLNYNFPKDLTNKLKISALRLYVSATNLAIWTKYTGFTPDVNSLRFNTRLGHDMSNAPPRRLIRMGLNMKF